MPRRPLYAARGRPWMERIKDLFVDPRTWSTQLYFLMMLPLGIVYFTLVVTLLSLSIAFVVAPVLVWLGIGDASFSADGLQIDGIGDLVIGSSLQPWELPLLFVAGFVLLFATLHLARGIGRMHGLLAKHLLVKSAQYS